MLKKTIVWLHKNIKNMIFQEMFCLKIDLSLSKSKFAFHIML